MNFGERLSYLLDERGMSQKDLAGELHMASSTLNGYIKGHRQPDYGTLIKVAKYFQVSTDYLLGVTELRFYSDVPLNVREEGLVGLYRNLQPDKQELLMEQAQFYHSQGIRKKERERAKEKNRKKV